MFFIVSPSRNYWATRIFKSYMLFRQRCVSAILLSIRLLSRHSNRPITMVHPYYDGGYRYAKSHPSADMPGLFLAFHFVADFRLTLL